MAASANGGAGTEGLRFKRDDAGDIGTSAAVATAVCLLLLAVWVAVQVKAKRGQGAKFNFPLRFLRLASSVSGERSLRVLESAPLTAHVRLHVVNWRGKEFLISTAAETVRVLDRAESASDADGGKAEASVRSRRRK
ncbi:MAG: flagellar biosynthetic protein FliO [Massilia sp.]